MRHNSKTKFTVTMIRLIRSILVQGLPRSKVNYLQSLFSRYYLRQST